MVRLIIAGLVSGILLMVLDAIISANSYSQKIYEVFKPVLKTTINLPFNLFVYLFNGFALALFFLFLYKILPGDIGIVKGISFALIIWYFRNFMAVIFQWMMFPIPKQVIGYAWITGLIEMLVIGMVYGLLLKKII